MHWVVLVASGLLFTVSFANAAYDAAEVLRKVTEIVQEREEAIRDCTCVETVTRNFFMPAVRWLPKSCTTIGIDSTERANDPTVVSFRATSTDRLRLEVTMTVQGEIYSWLDASRFDGRISTVVPRGPIASGGFGGVLKAIFREGADTIVFRCETTLNGRTLLEYSFKVDREQSEYMTKTARNTWIRTAYHGKFLVDPLKSALIRVELNADDLPPITETCNAMILLEFDEHSTIDAVLLPSRVLQRFVSTTGRLTENTIGFSNCRTYQSESRVTFSGKPEIPLSSAESSVLNLRSIPSGLEFAMELVTPIQPAIAAAGDHFAGRLIAPLRDTKHKTLAPKGAVVEGRLLRVEIVHTPVEAVTLVLRPQTLVIGADRLPLAASRLWRSSSRGTKILLPYAWENNSGVFEFRAARIISGHWFKSEWRTLPVAK